MLQSKLNAEFAKKGIMLEPRKLFVFRAGGSSKLTAVEDYLHGIYDKVRLNTFDLLTNAESSTYGA